MDDVFDFRGESAEINIEDIMNEIRAEIQAKKYPEVGFAAVDREMGKGSITSALSSQANLDLRLLSEKIVLSTAEPITSSKPIIGPILRLYKKVVRKMVRWYMDTVARQQEDYNRTAHQVLENLNEQLFVYNTVSAEIVKQNNSLLTQVYQYQDQLEAATDKISALENRIAELEISKTAKD